MPPYLGYFTVNDRLVQVGITHLPSFLICSAATRSVLFTPQRFGENKTVGDIGWGSGEWFDTILIGGKFIPPPKINLFIMGDTVLRTSHSETAIPFTTLASRVEIILYISIHPKNRNSCRSPQH
jgi:hypothetical protein